MWLGSFGKHADTLRESNSSEGKHRKIRVKAMRIKARPSNTFSCICRSCVTLTFKIPVMTLLQNTNRKSFSKSKNQKTKKWQGPRFGDSRFQLDAVGILLEWNCIYFANLLAWTWNIFGGNCSQNLLDFLAEFLVENVNIFGGFLLAKPVFLASSIIVFTPYCLSQFLSL